MNNNKTKQSKIKTFVNVSPVMEWVYDHGILVSRNDTRYKTYLKRNYMYNQPAAFIHKQK